MFVSDLSLKHSILEWHHDLAIDWRRTIEVRTRTVGRLQYRRFKDKQLEMGTIPVLLHYFSLRKSLQPANISVLTMVAREIEVKFPISRGLVTPRPQQADSSFQSEKQTDSTVRTTDKVNFVEVVTEELWRIQSVDLLTVSGTPPPSIRPVSAKTASADSEEARR